MTSGAGARGRGNIRVRCLAMCLGSLVDARAGATESVFQRWSMTNSKDHGQRSLDNLYLFRDTERAHKHHESIYETEPTNV